MSNVQLMQFSIFFSELAQNITELQKRPNRNITSCYEFLFDLYIVRLIPTSCKFWVGRVLRSTANEMEIWVEKLHF